MVKRQRQHIDQLAGMTAKLKDALPSGHPLAAEAGNILANHERLYPSRKVRAIAPPPDHQLSER